MKRRMHLLLLGLLLLAGLGGVRHLAPYFPESLHAVLTATAPWLFGDATPGKNGVKGEAAEEKKNPKETPEQLLARLSAQTDPNALPDGLTSIDGRGGSGLEQSVRKGSIWFPVYDLGATVASGNLVRSVVPLRIASGPLPKVPLQGVLQFHAEAVGGTPPYHWALSPANGLLQVDENTGVITSGVLPQPLRQTYALEVKDAAAAAVTAKLELSVSSDKPLTITTTELTTAEPNHPYQAQFAASGGLPPYRWTFQQLPLGFTGSTAGQISGTSDIAGEYLITAQVTDALEETISTQVRLLVTESLQILTEAVLPSVNPGEAWQAQLEAQGGQAPYQWTLLMQEAAGIQLDPATGLLAGSGSGEVVWQLPILLTDATGNEFRKTFILTVSDLLLVQAGHEKVGLAWQPERIWSLLAKSGLAPNTLSLQRDGKEIYSGRGSSYVDGKLASGATKSYQLVASLTNGTELPLGTAKNVQLKPFSLARANAGVADPYVDAVASFAPLTAGGYGAAKMPQNILGPPDGRSTFSPAYRPEEVLSLHASNRGGGSIELEFTDNILALGPGEDLTIFENVLFIGNNPSLRFMEPAIVSVALFPGEWHRLPTDVIPPADGQNINFRDPFYYARGFAGRNATTGDDPTDPRRSGGDSFDLNPLLDPLGITWVRFVRIQSTGDAVFTDNNGSDPIRHAADAAFAPLTGTGASGFDLDAVTALHY
jgi:hypothetical protein